MKSVRETPKFHARMLIAAVVAAWLGAASMAALASPVAIQDGFVQAGVNDVGSLGSGGATSPGILYDPTGSGSYGINDFLAPADPFEGYYVTVRYFDFLLHYGCNNDAVGSCDFSSSPPSPLSATAASWTGSTADGILAVTNAYTLTTIGGHSVIAITTTLTNNNSSTAQDVVFLRTLDPDPDVNAFGSAFTDNAVLSDDRACGTGPDTGATICIFSVSPFTHKAGVSADWSTDPHVYLGGIDDGDGNYAIGMAFALGSLGAGDSVTFDYGYSFAAARVPEPSGLAMLGVGLLGVLGLFGFDARRRRRGVGSHA